MCDEESKQLHAIAGAAALLVNVDYSEQDSDSQIQFNALWLNLIKSYSGFTGAVAISPPASQVSMFCGQPEPGDNGTTARTIVRAAHLLEEDLQRLQMDPPPLIYSRTTRIRLIEARLPPKNAERKAAGEWLRRAAGFKIADVTQARLEAAELKEASCRPRSLLLRFATRRNV